MARKLKYDNLPKIVGINLHPAAKSEKRDGKRQRYETRDVMSYIFEDGKKLTAGPGLEIEHASAMVLCKLAAQRIITDEGWMHGEHLCQQRDGTQASKAIYHLSSSISRNCGVRLPIENNKLGSYRLAIDPQAISFTVTDLERCDDAKVRELIDKVKSERPEAVNGDKHEATAV